MGIRDDECCNKVLALVKEQATRMEVIDNKFDKLLVAIDNHMVQIFALLADRSKNTVPVATFGWIAFILILSILAASFGIGEVKEVLKVIHPKGE